MRAGIFSIFSSERVAVITIGCNLAELFTEDSAETVVENPIAIAIAPTSAVGLKRIDMICSIHSLPVNDWWMGTTGGYPDLNINIALQY